MSRFFIDRPIFAWVLGLVLMLAGGIEIFLLPVAQFPGIAAPQISITVTYPGASAQTVADTVVQPILQQMSALDGLEYIASSTQSDGSMEIDLTFIQGTDPNIAQVQVQNKLSLAEAFLPTEVTQQGIKVNKSVKNFMLVVGLISTDGSMSATDISDYIASHIQDPLTRIPGVGDFTLFGAEYAMRTWLDPDKLYKYSLTVGDVTSAIAAQNVQISSGELGGMPSRKGQRLDATIIGPSRFEKPEQFENILLKVNQDGSQVRLRDVARVELGAQQYTPTSLYNGEPASALALKLAPGANQLSTGGRGQGGARSPVAVLSARPEDRLSARHRALHHALAHRSGEDAVRSGGARLRGDVHLPAELPRHADSHDRRADRAAGDVWRAGGLRLLDQHADDARHGAGGRPPGRRRDRGGGERRARDERAPAVAARGGTRVHGRDLGGPRRHRPGAGCGVPAHGVLQRLDWRHLSPVLRDDHLRHGALRAGRAHPDAGAVCHATEAR